MSTLTTILGGDFETNSRTVINTNFSNLNTDKMETSVLDTDTSLAANSDAKIPSQKAVKAYVDTGGNTNASTTTRGIVEEATSAEMIAGTAAGGTGARLFLNPSLVAETGNDKIVKTKSTGVLDPTIYPATRAAGVFTKDVSSTTTTTIAHGLVTTPTFIEINGVLTTDAVNITKSYYVNSTQYSLFVQGDTGTGTAETSGSTFRFQSSGTGNFLDGTITADATNITITWAKTLTPTGTASLTWFAIK